MPNLPLPYTAVVRYKYPTLVSVCICGCRGCDDTIQRVEIVVGHGGRVCGSGPFEDEVVADGSFSGIGGVIEEPEPGNAGGLRLRGDAQRKGGSNGQEWGF